MRQRPVTLASLGKKFGISRERVRQLELRAVAKLRTLLQRRRASTRATSTTAKTTASAAAA